MELLKDQSDVIATKSSEFRLTEPIDVYTIDQHLAAIGLIKTRDHIHQRGFTRATLSHQRGTLARTQVPAQILRYLDHIASVTE